MSIAQNTATLDWDSREIAALIWSALEEDLGGQVTAARDLTAAAVVPAETPARGRIVAKQELILAGMPLAERVFRALDPGVRIEAKFAEGARVPAQSVLVRVEGRARNLLASERTALNFLARLCGIATLTRQFVEAIAGTKTRLRDTRKTTPLLRAIEKYAVRTGGGTNHRFGLYDAILIKENHIALAGGVTWAIERAREARSRELTAYEAFRPPVEAVSIQVEVRGEAELREALAAGADAVLLDNVTPPEASRLIAIARKENAACVVEVSGGVNLVNARAYAEAGADFISVGALTHSAPAADLSLLVESPGVE